RAHVARRGDDHLLALEGRIQVRHDAHRPRLAFAVHLGWRAVLAPRAERAIGELLLRGRLDLPALGSGTPCAARRVDDLAPGELGAGDQSLARSRNGLIRSIGAGKIIVEEFEPPISRSV